MGLSLADDQANTATWVTFDRSAQRSDDFADASYIGKFLDCSVPGGSVKLHRVVIVAGATLIGAACSGEEPVAAPQTTAVVAQTIAPAPVTTAPTPTTTVLIDEVPESLAFGSARDVGRLFEIDGATQVLDSPAGEVASTLQDGLLVLAAAARTGGDTLFVGIVDPNDPTIALGWVDSQRLRPTTQVFTSTDESRIDQLGAAVRTSGQDNIDVVVSPGSSSVVSTLEHRETVLFSGTQARSSDGRTWLEVLTTTSGDPIGWVNSRNWAPVRGNLAQDGDFSDTSRRPSNAVTYGAPLPLVQASTIGCNAVSIEIANPSSSQGMAFIFANEVPFAIVGQDPETWQGSRLFVEPGDSTTLTLLNESAATWYFAGLNSDLVANADRLVGGTLAGLEGSRSLAVDVQQVAVATGSCAFVPPPVENNDEYDLSGGVEEELEEEFEEVDGDIEGEIDGTETVDQDPPETTVSSTTTTVAPTTTTIASTTTTTVAPTTTAPVDGTGDQPAQ